MKQLLTTFLLLLTIMGTGFAQETNYIAFDNGIISFNHPDNWIVDETGDFLVLTLADEDDTDGYITFYPAEFVLETAIESSDPQSLLVNFVESLEIDLSDSQSDIFETDTLVIVAETTATSGAFMVSDLEGNLITVVIADDENALAVTPDIIMTINGSTPREACTVSTDTDRSATLRVGPGTNRTSITFLPANESFEVLGEAVDDTGARWFKLDKEVVAPGSSATELWVLADDVASSGDCENVGQAFAPPIIPIIAAPASTDGDENNSTTAPAIEVDTSGLETDIADIVAGNVGAPVYTFDFVVGAVIENGIFQFQVLDGGQYLTYEICGMPQPNAPYCRNYGIFTLVGENIWWKPYTAGGVYFQMIDEGVFRRITITGESEILTRTYTMTLSQLPEEYQSGSSLVHPDELR